MLKLKTHNKGTTTGYQSGLQERIWKYKPEALNKIIDEFYATFCTKDGGDCESDNFRVMVTAVDRYITEVRYKRSIILWRGLKSLKQIIEKKAQLLWQQLASLDTK